VDQCYLAGGAIGQAYGIYLSNVSNADIRSNIFYQKHDGIHVSGSSCIGDNNSFILNNSMSNLAGSGIRTLFSSNLIIKENTIELCSENGIHIGTSCQDIFVFNNTLCDNVFYGALLENCLFNVVSNNNLSGNDRGVLLTLATNNTIVGNTVSANTIGISVDSQAIDNRVWYNTIYGNDVGIFNWESNRNLIFSNTIYNNLGFGIKDQESSYNEIRENSLFGNGLYLYDTTNISVEENTITNSTGEGIYIHQTDHCSIQDNTLFNNTVGIYISTFSSNNSVVDNFILNSTGYGIHCIPETEDNIIYLNRIAYNLGGNAYDNGTNNQWNSTLIGNYWSDYSGIGVYQISGLAEAIDYHPMSYPEDLIPPTIDHPEDITYTEGETGNSITWNPNDTSPSEYTILLNGIQGDNQIWDGGPIVIGIDGLSPGEYNYTIIVYNILGNYVVDTVIVIVLAITTTPSTSPTTTTTPVTTTPSTSEPYVPELDGQLMIIVAIGIIGLVVVIGIVLLIRR